jgi:hypothetical protein
MTKFEAPKPIYKKEPDERYKERYKRTLEAYKRANFSYDPTSYSERKKNMMENLNINLQRQWPEYVTERLVSIQRVLLPQSDMFELPSGKLTSKQSALVYKVTVEIASENARRAGYHKLIELDDFGAGASSHTYTIGRYQRPIVEPTKYDRQGNVIDARIRAYHHTYYVDDRPDTIKSILKRYNTDRPIQGFIVALANVSGNPYAGSFTMIDESDFTSAKIEDIISGNRIGLPVGAFKQWQSKKHQLIRGGIATKAQLEKLTANDLVNLISNMEKSGSGK